MEFRTKVPIEPQEPKIGYDSDILLLGSCFVENMGKKLDNYKFRTLLNPFGILFHPAAIKSILERIQSRRDFSEEDIFFHKERWHSFDVHSALSRPDKNKTLQQLNFAFEKTSEFLKKASHVIITPGTAWGYRYRESDKIVANCHKVPQKKFKKELTDVKSDLAECSSIIAEINPQAKLIFTVSPVRHLRDGFVENQHSKSRLISAIQEILDAQADIPPLGDRGAYFPSYELMMDELRDYRFYAEDMVHPNKTAIHYIWQRFAETWISSETISVMERVEIIQKGLAHRPFNASSKAHQKFLQSLEEQIQEMERKHPYISF